MCADSAWIANTPQAIENKATVPIYYESRLAELDLPEELKPRIAEEFEEVTEGEEVERKERLKTKWAQLEAVVVGGEAASLDCSGHRGALRAPAGSTGQQGDGGLRGPSRICENLYNGIARLRAGGGAERALSIRDDVEFFQAVRAVLAKRVPAEQRTEKDLDPAIQQIVSRVIAPEGVVDPFATVGLKKPDIFIFSEAFLAEVRGMPQKNFVMVLGRKLLAGEIETRAQAEAALAKRKEKGIRTVIVALADGNKKGRLWAAPCPTWAVLLTSRSRHRRPW